MTYNVLSGTLSTNQLSMAFILTLYVCYCELPNKISVDRTDKQNPIQNICNYCFSFLNPPVVIHCIS